MIVFKRIALASLIIAVALCSFLTAVAMGTDVKKMSKEELKSIMDNEGVNIIDVRRGKDWSSSEFKIKGADRVDGSDFSSWADKYPQENTLVLYCA